ncbi:hypothetical protein, partial [Pseudomonas savastanoi]|uniref:hypothetical protein n=1 Tax=Pseudomonas savastanoi TaxID=29438 RepID=UPI00197D3487
MPIDMDRYYTPENVAIQAMERGSFLSTPMVCADSTCGSGRLLDAANTVFGSVRSIGIDRDVEAISQLRLRRPGWQLSVGDLLSHESIDVAREQQAIDLLVLNPPFSHGKRKFVDINFGGKEMTGSIAMAHILRSFEIFRPKLGAVVVAPESLLYSETDQLARHTLEESYRIEKLQICNAARFEAPEYKHRLCRSALAPSAASRSTSFITLELFKAPLSEAAFQFIYETRSCRGAIHSLYRLASRGSRLGRATPYQDFQDGKRSDKGMGHFDSQGGSSEAQMINVVKLSEVVQLSDCVIALKFSTKANALLAQ